MPAIVKICCAVGLFGRADRLRLPFREASTPDQSSKRSPTDPLCVGERNIVFEKRTSALS